MITDDEILQVADAYGADASFKYQTATFSADQLFAFVRRMMAMQKAVDAAICEGMCGDHLPHECASAIRSQK